MTGLPEKPEWPKEGHETRRRASDSAAIPSAPNGRRIEVTRGLEFALKEIRADLQDKRRQLRRHEQFTPPSEDRLHKRLRHQAGLRKRAKKLLADQ